MYEIDILYTLDDIIKCKSMKDLSDINIYFYFRIKTIVNKIHKLDEMFADLNYINIIRNDYEIIKLSRFVEREEEIYLIVENLRLLNLIEINEDCRTYVIDMCKYYDRLIFHKTCIDNLLLDSNYYDEKLFDLFDYLIYLPKLPLDKLSLFVKKNNNKLTNTYFIRIHQGLDLLEKLKQDYPYYEPDKDVDKIRNKLIYLTFIWSSIKN